MYLAENGLNMYLWLGANLDQMVVQNLFGIAAAQQLNVEKVKKRKTFIKANQIFQ
jgi:hypothetical protein